ncbi:hypothetical protein C8R44DRAFT_827414 [Mycena epipterygia]|nr:hypothetical protein C8R44DRAFT_827414 [Mycena epipterygia]
MPNPKGINGYGDKTPPSDAYLKDALLRYASQGLKLDQRIANLKSDLNYSIGSKPPPLEVARQTVIEKVQEDILQGNGPNYFKTVLQQEGIMIPRDTIRQIMLKHFPLGFDHGFPGKRKAPVPRTPLNSNGPFHEISDTILFLSFVPNSRTAAAIGHLYLDFIEMTGAIPIQLTMDKGSEIGWQYAIQDALRVHNTIIEGFWRWFKEKKGLNLKAVILVGKQDRIFSSDVEFHSWLFYWIFIPLLQAELAEFRLWWNHHRVRTQQDKNMPSGHVPYDALDHPQNYAGLDCRIPVPQDAVDDLRNMVTEDVGPREAHLSWFSREFDDLAHVIYAQIGKPRLSLDTAWNVFRDMLEPMAIVIEV